MNKRALAEQGYEQLHFVVTGEFITRQARTFVLEYQWEKAVDFLVASLHGLSYDLAIDICKGKSKLVGDSDSGVDIVSDLDDEAEEYHKRLAAMFAGYYRYKDKFYRPYAYVSNYGKQDIDAVPPYKHYSSGRVLGRAGHAETPSGKDLSNRPWHYADDVTDEIRYLQIANEGLFAVIFKEVASIPIWLRQESFLDSQEALDAFLKNGGHLNERGHFQTYGSWKSDDLFREAEKAPVQEPPTLPEENEEYDEPIISKALEARYGWISPDGDFYGCCWTEHRSLAVALCKKFYPGGEGDDEERLLDKQGWVRLSDSVVPPHGVLFLHIGKLTQAQMDTIFDWCQKHERSLPKNLQEQDD